MFAENRSLHDSSGGYLQKRHPQHVSPPTIPGTRVYPYPGTTQESVRNSYHNSTSHSASISHHLSTLYNIGTNSHSAAVGPQVYGRDGNYSVERHDFSPIDRYRNRNETNELHHSNAGGGGHSHGMSAGAGSGHNQPQVVRRRPSLLPHVPNEYSVLSANAGLTSPYMSSRDRYDLAYRYAAYESQTKGPGIQSSPMSMPSTTVSQHTGPTQMHMFHQGSHALPLSYSHQTPAIVSSPHMSQSHLLQDIQEMNERNKRPRLGFGNDHRSYQPLLIDTRDMVEVKKEPAYTPQVEAISPTLPNEDSRQDMSPTKTTKDELLQSINKIDREIMQTEAQLTKLRKKQQELELVTNKPSAETEELQIQESSALDSHLSVAQVIYSDNKAKTLKIHSQFDKLGPIIELPLYNQPSDTPIYHENKRKFISFKKSLIVFFKKRYQDKQLRERYLTDTYDKLMLSWLKKLEKKETNPPKKQKDVKLREYFEKQFPELRKQREDKERFSRVGQRIRSDAELEEIMDGLQEQELEDKKMRSYAVIPPILLDSRHRKYNFINKNGIIEDTMSEHTERQLLNIWTDQEKDIFKEKYLIHPKNFAFIASFLDRKNVRECVQYYYMSKKGENYKQLLRKQVKKRTRALVKAQQQQAIAAQAQQPGPPQPKPTPSVVGRQTDEIKVTTAIVTTTTTTSVVNSITSTTNTISASNVSKVCEPVNDVSATPDGKADTAMNDSPIKCDNVINSDEAINDENTPCDILCCLCHTKVENPVKSRAITLSNLNVYNISESAFKQGMRVCLMCHFKNVRRSCPLPSCKTPRRKVKRLKSFPQQWFDLSAESRQMYANDLNVPEEVRSACPRCVMRLSRRIGVIAPSDRTDINQNNESPTWLCWSDNEIQMFKQFIRELGRNWSAIANQIRTKTDKECRDFYSHNKYSQNLDKIFKEFLINSGKTGKESDSEDFWSDGDSEETSSAEEGHGCNSDTASASSPISKVPEDIDNKLSINDKTGNAVCSTNNHSFREDFVKLQDYKGLSASQTSLKSDYDSSATMSADEGQGGNGDNDRPSSSPAVSLPPRANSAMPAFPPSNMYFQQQPIDKHVRPASHDAAFAVEMLTKSSHSVLRNTEPPTNAINSRQKVPPFLINPNAPSTQPSVSSAHVQNVQNKEEPTCVRDLIYQAIEMSLQSPMKGIRTNSQPMVNNEANKMDTIEGMPSSVYGTLPNIKRENVIDMTKSDMNRNSPSRPSIYKNSDIQRPEGLAMMASYSQHLSPSSGHGPNPYNMMLESDEYEVQDLSKKERRLDNYSPRNYSPSIKDKMHSHRNDYPYGLIPTAHSNPNRGGTPHNEQSMGDNKDNYNLMKHLDSGRLINSYQLNDNRLHSQDMKQHSRSSPLSRTLNKVPVSKSSPVPPPPPLITSGKSSQPYPQLSPKLSYKDKMVPVSAPSGGSITQGTPGIQPNSFSYGPNRYEGLLRQIPPSVHKEGGSITLGTPLMGGAVANIPIDHRRKGDLMVGDPNRAQVLSRNSAMYEPSNMEQYYRRSSSPQTHPYSPAFQASDFKMNKPLYPKESHLSTNQIMIDFNTSKQMLTRRGSNSSDKDIHSSTPINNPMESRPTHSEHKNLSQNQMNRQTNSYPNYSQNSTNSPSPVYPSADRVPPQRDNHPPMMGSTDTHLSHWPGRHPTMGAQSPNYNRQNVIQHWNAGNIKPSVIQTPKSSSPRDYRTEAISPVAHPVMRPSVSPQVPITSHSMFNQQHDAFTTLVNAAAAQQSLAVPPPVDRRSGSGSMSRTDLMIRQSMKPSAEGLEKSLMENFHGRPPRNYGENDLNKSDDKLRQMSHENDHKMFGQNRSVGPPTDEFMFLEQRRRHELEQLADIERHGYNRSMAEHQTHVSQPSLRFSREPFTKEQFEKEFGQQAAEHHNRHLTDPTIRMKSEDLDMSVETRHPSVGRPQANELDNEASKLFSQSFQKDNQKPNSSRGQFTAANLIDAIITHQINSSTESPNGKTNANVVNNPNVSEAPQTGVDSLFARYRNSEKHIPSQYPNREEVVTIADSPDPDKGHHSNHEKFINTTSASDYSKGITLGDHINTIISKNYTNDGRPLMNPSLQTESRTGGSMFGMPSMSMEGPRNLMLPIVSTSSTVLEGIAATAVSNVSSDSANSSTANQSPPHSSWKLRKALQQDKEAKEPDERQIIRVVQNVSPKSTSTKSISPALSHYNVEPISPPTHSTDSVPQMTTIYNPMQTSWTPSAGLQTNALTNRHFYSADSSNACNSQNLLKPVHPIVSTTNQLNTNNNRINQPQIGLSPLDYVKNKIVEAMRTTGDEPNDDTMKRVNSEVLPSNDNKTKEEKDLKFTNDSSSSHRVVSTEVTVNTNDLHISQSRDLSKSSSIADTSASISTIPSVPESTSSVNTQNIVINVSQESDETPAKRRKLSTEHKESAESDRVGITSNTKTNAPMVSDITVSIDTKPVDSEAGISQMSSHKVIKSDDIKMMENTSNVSSDCIDNKPSTCEQSNCEVSSARNDDMSGKPDPKHIYPDSPNSPGEMVIDESDHNLSSSSPPVDKTDSDSPLTPNTSSTTQQSLISTTDVVKSESSTGGGPNTAAIGSTSNLNDTQNQSESVSSSVIETKRSSAEVSAPSSANIESTFTIKSTTPAVVTTQSDALNGHNSSANSVSSSALPSVESNSSSADSGSKGVANTSGVSSSIGMSVESLTQSTGSPSIQSSAISGSGTPSSTTSSALLAPQYEPLSDDE